MGKGHLGSVEDVDRDGREKGAGQPEHILYMDATVKESTITKSKL